MKSCQTSPASTHHLQRRSLVSSENMPSMMVFVIYRYILWIFDLFGCVGHLLTIYVFCRSRFYTHPCSHYFLALTWTNLIFVLIFIPLAILQYGFSIDPRSSSLVFCKMYFFLHDALRILIAWLLTLACINRYCFTSPNVGLRQLSALSNTRFIISFFSLMVFCGNIPLIIFYQITLNQCILRLDISPKYLDLLIQFLIPTFFICLSRLLIWKNIHQERKRISPFMIDVVYNHHFIRKKRQRDNQIYRMLFTQCALWFLMNFLLFINETFLFLSHIHHCITICFFALSSSFFRREVFQFYKKFSRSIVRVQ